MGCGGSVVPPTGKNSPASQPATATEPTKPATAPSAVTSVAAAPPPPAVSENGKPQNYDEAIAAATTELDLSGETWPGQAALGDVPQSLFDKSALQTLILKKCCISELPEGVSELKQLKTLDISENTLGALPKGLEGCSLLESLDCSDNGLTQFPDIVLPSVRELNAYKNAFTKLPDSLGQWSSLELVNFFNNKIIKMPPSFANLTQLDDVNFASNKLKTLPKTDQWKKLKRLAVFWNNLVMLPSFAGLESLECLQMYDNSLETFPEMGNHPQLKEIDLSGNRIAALRAEDFSQMPALESFQVAKNMLEELPLQILQSCPQLNLLNVSGNPLGALPEEVGGCEALQVLFWAKTRCTALPATLEALGPKLARVDFEGHEFDSDTRAMCDRLEQVVVANGGFFKF